MPDTALRPLLRPCRPISHRQWLPLRFLFRRPRTAQRSSYLVKLGPGSRMSVLRITFWIRMRFRVLGLRWGRFRINIGGIALRLLEWCQCQWSGWEFGGLCLVTLSINFMIYAPFSHFSVILNFLLLFQGSTYHLDLYHSPPQR